MLENIEKVLDKKVRPALLRHEGNVRIADYSDGILQNQPDRTMFRLPVCQDHDGRIDKKSSDGRGA